MPAISAEVIVNGAPQRVWDFVTALPYLRVWMAGVVGVTAISTPETAAGTTFELARRGAHRPEEWVVADYDPPRRLRLAEYRQNRQLVLRLEPVAAGTRVLVEEEWPGRRGLLDRLMPPTRQRRALQQSLARLRELVRLNQDIKFLHGMGDE